MEHSTAEQFAEEPAEEFAEELAEELAGPTQEMRLRDTTNIVFANIHAPRVRHAGSAGLSAKHAEKVVKP